MTLHDFLRRRKYLVWYTRNYDRLSTGAIVEAVLNYGNFEDVKKVISILGIRRTASIFRKQASRKRSNYRPEIKNYFRLYFKKYAPSA
jgi:hypothetical protein